MSSFSISKEPKPFALTHWELKAPDALRDLVIKKIVISLIAILNLAAIGAVVYLIVSYCKIPTTAILITPFVVGVLAALPNLKIPTFGVSSQNASAFLNPSSLIGRILGYLFFGPFQFVANRIDWTPYHDPFCANTISKDLEEESFEKIAHDYGKNFDNLIKYGFIHKQYAQQLDDLYHEYLPVKKKISFLKSARLEDNERFVAALERKREIEAKWQDLKKRFEYPFPHPPMPDFDFSSKITHVRLKARSVCCFGPPIDMIKDLKA